MAKTNNLTDFLTDVADAIRAKKGTSGLINPQDFSSEIASIPTGGGDVDHGGKYLVEVIDYDGTVLKSDHLNAGEIFTLPEPPEHERLVFKEWASPVDLQEDESGNKYVTVDGYICMGALYTSKTGNTELEFLLTPVTGLNVSIKLDSNTDCNIDWGDGSPLESNAGGGTITHIYTDYGQYIVSFGGARVSFAYDIFGSISNINMGEGNHSCIGVCFASNAYVSQLNSFRYWTALEYVIITTDFSGYLPRFQYSGLRAMIIPPNANLRGAQFTLPYNYRFEHIVFQPGMWFDNNSGITYSLRLAHVRFPSSIYGSATPRFSNCSLTGTVVVPEYITTVNQFSSCANIDAMIYLGDITNIVQSAVKGSYFLRYLGLTHCTQVPTLSSAQEFRTCKCIIGVPDSLYNEFISATNWSAYADQIVKESELPDWVNEL